MCNVTVVAIDCTSVVLCSSVCGFMLWRDVMLLLKTNGGCFFILIVTYGVVSSRASLDYLVVCERRGMRDTVEEKTGSESDAGVVS